MRFQAIIPFAFLSMGSGISVAIGQPVARTIFDQLPAVAVHVVGLNPAIDSVGVDSGPLRVALETRLQEEGIAILEADQLLATPDVARLVVQVGGFSVDSAFIYTVTLELLEPVRLERSGLKVLGYGWSKLVAGVAERSEVRAAVEDAVDRLAGLFLDGRRLALAVAVR